MKIENIKEASAISRDIEDFKKQIALLENNKISIDIIDWQWHSVGRLSAYKDLEKEQLDIIKVILIDSYKKIILKSEDRFNELDKL